MENVTQFPVVNDKVRIVQDHTITLTDHWNFHVAGPEFTQYDGVFSSYNSAVEEIMKRVEKTRKHEEVSKKVQFGENMIDKSGQRVRIIGIDRRNGHLLFDGKKSSNDDMYADMPWVVNAIQQRNELRKQFDQLNAMLMKVRVSGNRTYGRIDPEDYEKKLDSLRQEIVRAKQSAIQIADEMTKLTVVK